MASEAQTTALLVSLLLAACTTSNSLETEQILSHGVAIGEVTHDSAVIWARCVGGSRVPVRFEPGGRNRERTMQVTADSDWTGRVQLDSLHPETLYEYTVDCGAGGSGTFHTAPAPSTPAALRIAWGGDIGGQNSCRDEIAGYSIFSRVIETNPDLFLAVGDMVYVDNDCRQIGRYGNRQVPGPPRALDLDTFRRHWAYNRSDPHLQRLMTQVPYIGIWDDHEIRNDGGVADDKASGVDLHLFPMALRSFLEYAPLLPPEDEPTRLYRRLRWGKHAELFILDTRQYRDRNDLPDVHGAGKTMLGKAQLDWLRGSLRSSDATWRIVVSSVPLSIPTGRGPNARDGWSNHGGATGAENEATAILRDAARAGMSNLVWITTDVHFATGLRYLPFEDHPDFVVHEFVSGPLNAGVFPHNNLDPTFHPERLFLWGPDSLENIAGHKEALEWYNFGLIEIDESGELKVTIINGEGRRVATVPVARQP